MERSPHEWGWSKESEWLSPWFNNLKFNGILTISFLFFFLDSIYHECKIEHVMDEKCIKVPEVDQSGFRCTYTFARIWESFPNNHVDLHKQLFWKHSFTWVDTENNSDTWDSLQNIWIFQDVDCLLFFWPVPVRYGTVVSTPFQIQILLVSFFFF